MPIYIYWGEDEFTMGEAVKELRECILDPAWASFNYHIFPQENADTVVEALNQSMTPPFGGGKRLVWLKNTTLYKECPKNVLDELQNTLKVILPSTYLLLTNHYRPDPYLKSTKVLQKFATEFQHFPLVSPWKIDELVQAVEVTAKALEVNLTSKSAKFLAECVGNNTRLLHSELKKLRLYAGNEDQPLDVDKITSIVRSNTHNSLQLATAIRDGDTAKSLTLVAELIDASEPALRIVATLIGQFRTWAWVKIIMESRERDLKLIAEAIDIANHKRIYFLQKEVKRLSVQQLISTLPLLLDLEVNLKQGASQSSDLKAKVIELCQLYCRN